MVDPWNKSNDSRKVAEFQSTHWSMVLAAGRDRESQASSALAELCRIYWYPLYVFIRRKGHSADNAADLTQGFFADLMQRRDLAKVDPARGRFRSFLLTAFNHFIANQVDYEQAIKRGGGVNTWSFDRQSADERYQMEPAVDQPPEATFLKQWAVSLLERARAAVGRHYQATNKTNLYSHLEAYLTIDPPAESQATLAEKLGMNAATLKVAVHRLRQRFHRQIREEIAQTVATEEEIDDEINDLFLALRG